MAPPQLKQAGPQGFANIFRGRISCLDDTSVDRFTGLYFLTKLLRTVFQPFPYNPAGENTCSMLQILSQALWTDRFETLACLCVGLSRTCISLYGTSDPPYPARDAGLHICNLVKLFFSFQTTRIFVVVIVFFQYIFPRTSTQQYFWVHLVLFAFHFLSTKNMFFVYHAFCTCHLDTHGTNPAGPFLLLLQCFAWEMFQPLLFNSVGGRPRARGRLL